MNKHIATSKNWMMIMALVGLGFLASCGPGTDEDMGDPDAPVNINFEFLDAPFQGAYKIGETLRFRLTIDTERPGGFDIEEGRFDLTFLCASGCTRGHVYEFPYTIEPGVMSYEEEFTVVLDNPFAEGIEVYDIFIRLNVIAQNNGFRFAEEIDLGPAALNEYSGKLFNNYEGKDEADTTWNFNYAGNRYATNQQVIGSSLRDAWLQNNTFSTNPSGLTFVRGFKLNPRCTDKFLKANDYIRFEEHRFAPALEEIMTEHQDEVVTEFTDLAVGDVIIAFLPMNGKYYLLQVAAISDGQSVLDQNDYIEFNAKSQKY